MAGESSQGSRDHKGSERIVQSGQLGGDDKATGSGSANNLKMMYVISDTMMHFAHCLCQYGLEK